MNIRTRIESARARQRKIQRAAAQFLVEMARYAKDKVVNTATEAYRHWEAVCILVLAGIGLNGLLGELVFQFILPMWIEAPMVIPVLAVLAIGALIWNTERRATKRMAQVVNVA